MDLKTYLSEERGRAAKLAETLGVSQVTVHQWANKKQVAAERCPEIEKATNGAVRCEDLRPDVDWAYLRNSAQSVAVPPRIAPITCGSSDPRHASRRAEGVEMPPITIEHRATPGRRADDHNKEAA